MTPAQRQYDEDLITSLRNMAAWVLPRSRKMSSTLKLAADRLDALCSELPVTMPVDQSHTQPASTPDQANHA